MGAAGENHAVLLIRRSGSRVGVDSLRRNFPLRSLSANFPGGRLAVSDVVVRGEVPGEIRRNMELWVGCIAGAMQDDEYRAKLAKAGFQNIGIEPTRVYDVEDARAFLSGQGVDVDAIAAEVDGKFMSAFVRASKPVGCCAPGCCS